MKIANRDHSPGRRRGDPAHLLGAANRTAYQSRSRTALHLVAVALSLVAALIHLWATPEHLEEWWGYGTFLLTVATAQGFYGVALLRLPNRPLLLVGVGGNLSIVVLYILTRTVGIPFFGPHAGEVEGVGVADLAATAAELALVAALLAVLLRGLSPERVRTVLLISAVVVVSLGHLIHLLLRESSGH